MRQNVMTKDRKMKLTLVLNSEDGVRRAGCRASGIYRGHHIERTASVPYEEFPGMQRELEMLVTGRYNAECRKIDRV